MQNRLSNCPFCGSSNVNDTSEPYFSEDIDLPQAWVCPDCVACGPVGMTVEECTEAWNRRTPAPLSPVEGEKTWKTMESAPKHTNVLVFRDDAGEPWIAQYTDETFYDAEDGDPDKMGWFSAYGRHEGDETPTHWMSIPDGPALTGGKPE